MCDDQSRYCKASSRGVGHQEWQIEVNSDTGNPLRFLVLVLTSTVLQVMVLAMPSVTLPKSLSLLSDANCTALGVLHINMDPLIAFTVLEAHNSWM